MSLKEILEQIQLKKVALGHFNISDTAGLRAVFDTAKELGLAVLIGVSEGERDFIGVKQVGVLVKSLQEEFSAKGRNYPIFLNADHTHSLDKVKEAALAGFDEILFDGSKLSLEENVRQTRQAVEIAKSINPNILIEGEIGYIGSGSEIHQVVALSKEEFQANLTTPEQALSFIKETGIDVLAPAVGTTHGLLPQMVIKQEFKHLDIERIRAIKQATNIFLTLHGGSGTWDEDFTKAIDAGINIIHISTELRLAWRKGLEEGLKNNPNEVAPYKILPAAVEGMKKIVKERLKLFNKLA